MNTLKDVYKEVMYNPDNLESVKKYYNASSENRIFLISPVANSTEEDRSFIEKYIEDKRSLGLFVYYPRIHTFQEDNIGLTIMNTNAEAMKAAGKIESYFDPESKGSVADLGMVKALRKDFEVINKGLVDSVEAQRDPLRLFAEYVLRDSLYEKGFLEEKMPYFDSQETIFLSFNELLEDRFEFGYVFALEKMVYMENYKEKRRTRGKSHLNVVKELHEHFFRTSR